MFVLKIEPVRETFAWHIFYLSNLYMAKIGSYPGSVSHLWSLAIEEQFYLFWPWIILLLPRKFLFTRNSLSVSRRASIPRNRCPG